MKIYYRSANVEVPFQFQIPASGVNVYLAEDLPIGFTCSPTGLISGTPSVAEQRSITLLISNGVTCSAASLSLTVVGPPEPVILGANSAEGVVNFAFSYQIVATATPAITSYGASNLPAGLSVNTATGLISGTPTTATASTTVVVSATNSGGTTNKNVNFVILAMPRPVYSGSSAATLIKGVSNSFQVASSSPAPFQPTSFSATGLPSGMSINPSTGLISGTPTTVPPTDISNTDFFVNIIKLIEYNIGTASTFTGTQLSYETTRLKFTLTPGAEIPGALSFVGLFTHGSYTGSDIVSSSGARWIISTSILPNLSVFMEGAGDARRLDRINNPAARLYIIGGKNSGSNPDPSGSTNTWRNTTTGAQPPTSFGVASISRYQAASYVKSFVFGDDALWNLPTWPYYDQIFRLKNEKFLVASPSYSVNIPQISSRSSIIRLNSDGELDNTWTASFLAHRSLILGEKEDGTLVVYAEPNIHFLNPQGNILSTGSVSFSYRMSSVGYRIEHHITKYWLGFNFNHIKGGGLQPDGKIIMGRETDIIRISADGNTIDTSFSSPTDFAGFTQSIAGYVETIPVHIAQIYVYKNGKTLVCGLFGSFRGETNLYGLIRLMPDGSRDTSFNYTANDSFGGVGRTTGGACSSFRVLPDGRIVLLRPTVRATTSQGNYQFDTFVVLNSDGSLDTSTPFFSSIYNSIPYYTYSPDKSGSVLEYTWTRATRSTLSGPYGDDFSVTPTTATVTLTNAGGSTSVPINFSVVDY